jgi:creatinine amidohydrolase
VAPSLRSEAKIWEKLTVAEMRAALQESRTVLVPIGVTEQHGYHLTLDTDSQTAWQVCTRAAAQTGSFVAPLLSYGFSGGELPGTINIDYQLVGLFIKEIIRALAANGLRNIVLVLGHGGTEHGRATQDAAELFLRSHPEYADRNVGILRFWQDSELCRAAFDSGDYHAGYFETSLMMYWAPDDVRREAITLDRPALVQMMREDPDNYQVRSSNLEHSGIVKHIGQNPEIVVGVMGEPGRASVELGEQIANEAVAKLVELVAAMEAGDGIA